MRQSDNGSCDRWMPSVKQLPPSTETPSWPPHLDAKSHDATDPQGRVPRTQELSKRSTGGWVRGNEPPDGATSARTMAPVNTFEPLARLRLGPT